MIVLCCSWLKPKYIIANTHGSGVGMHMDLLKIVISQMLQILSESAVIQAGVLCNLHNLFYQFEPSSHVAVPSCRAMYQLASVTAGV